ncbi:hypothetical protein VIGAN_07088700, partial [Vigna angularis var. angularis]
RFVLPTWQTSHRSLSSWRWSWGVPRKREFPTLLPTPFTTTLRISIHGSKACWSNSTPNPPTPSSIPPPS